MKVMGLFSFLVLGGNSYKNQEGRAHAMGSPQRVPNSSENQEASGSLLKAVALPFEGWFLEEKVPA